MQLPPSLNHVNVNVPSLLLSTYRHRSLPPIPVLLAHAGALSMHATCPGHPRRAWRGVPRAVLGLTGGLTLLSGGELMARLGDVKASY